MTTFINVGNSKNSFPRLFDFVKKYFETHLAMKEKTVSEAINFRRSVRKYDPKKAIDTNLVKKCIEQARLAPTSSNLQLWEFYHIKSKDFLKKVAKVCYNQPAAKTAQELTKVEEL